MTSVRRVQSWVNKNVAITPLIVFFLLGTPFAYLKRKNDNTRDGKGEASPKDLHHIFYVTRVDPKSSEAKDRHVIISSHVRKT
jgi:hypothetical protein